jgi:hypothetical protein
VEIQASPDVWPYIIVGSAIGAAAGYLFVTESGRQVRHTIVRPDELASRIEELRNFIEDKACIVTNQIHAVVNKAKKGIEEGERAYRETGQRFHSGPLRKIEDQSNAFVTDAHKAVDNIGRTAATVEHSVVDPIFELGALLKGLEHGVRALLGKESGDGQPGSLGIADSDKTPFEKAGTVL